MALSVGNYNSNGSGGTYQFNHNCNGNLLLVVIANYNNAPTGITFNSDSLTRGPNTYDAGDNISEIWYLVNPDQGNYQVSVGGGMSYLIAAAISIIDADTSDPFRSTNTNTGESAAPTITVSSATGDLVVDALAYYTAGVSATVDGSQTELLNMDDLDQGGCSSYESGASSVAMDWSLSGSRYFAMCGVSIKPASSGVSGTLSKSLAAFTIDGDGSHIQIFAPTGDISTGNWTATGGGTLYDKIDEWPPSGSDVIRSGNDPSSDTCRISLQDRSDPIVHTGHRFPYWYRKQGGTAAINLTVSLYESTSLIAEQTHTTVPDGDGWIFGVLTLTEGQASGISNYNDLEMRFTANKP